MAEPGYVVEPQKPLAEIQHNLQYCENLWEGFAEELTLLRFCEAWVHSFIFKEGLGDVFLKGWQVISVSGMQQQQWTLVLTSQSFFRVQYDANKCAVSKYMRVSMQDILSVQMEQTQAEGGYCTRIWLYGTRDKANDKSTTENIAAGAEEVVEEAAAEKSKATKSGEPIYIDLFLDAPFYLSPEEQYTSICDLTLAFQWVHRRFITPATNICTVTTAMIRKVKSGESLDLDEAVEAAETVDLEATVDGQQIQAKTAGAVDEKLAEEVEEAEAAAVAQVDTAAKAELESATSVIDVKAVADTSEDEEMQAFVKRLTARISELEKKIDEEDARLERIEMDLKWKNGD